MARVIGAVLAALVLVTAMSGCVIHDHDRWRGRGYYGRDDRSRYGNDDRDRECWRDRGGYLVCRR